MKLAYEYDTKKEAQAAIDSGTALAFFQPFLDIALANVPDENRPYWKDTFFRVLPGVRRKSSSSYRTMVYSWQAYLLFDQGLKSPYGSTDVVMRKDGTVNQERLNEIVFLVTSWAASSNRAFKAHVLNKKALEDLPELYRQYVEPERTEGSFRLNFSESGVKFNRTVGFDEIVPILKALKVAATNIDHIRYPDQKES